MLPRWVTRWLKVLFAAMLWVVISPISGSCVNAPPVVTSLEPADGGKVFTATPLLRAHADDAENEPLRFTFEVREGSEQGPLVSMGAELIPDDLHQGAFLVYPPLKKEDGWYFWRAGARDSGGETGFSSWGSFFVSTSNNAPTTPTPLSPADGRELTLSTAVFYASGGSDPEGAPLSYEFEVDTVPTFDSFGKRASGAISPAGGQAWFAAGGLFDNQRYFWRVRATDGEAASDWVVRTFSVNFYNDPPTAPIVVSPALGASIQALEPVIALEGSTDADNDAIAYRFEVALKASFSEIVADTVQGDVAWHVTNGLAPNQSYFLRVRAEDPHGAVSAWTVSTFVINPDGVDDPPTIALLEPKEGLEIERGNVLESSWSDDDPDSDAQVTIALDDVVLSTLSEDLDGEGDRFAWNTASASYGRHTLCVEIADNTSKPSGSCRSFTVRYPLTLDIDGDAVPNSVDNCPYVFNPTQLDSGGFYGRVRDGIGDACQCGDVTGNGLITSLDVKMILAVWTGQQAAAFRRSELCNVSGSSRCNDHDARTLSRMLSRARSGRKRSRPSIAEIRRLQVCPAAKG